MTQPITTRPRPAGGFVDNARALPTTPPTPQPQPRRTFSSSYKADIFTRCRQSRQSFVRTCRQNLFRQNIARCSVGRSLLPSDTLTQPAARTESWFRA